MTTRKAPIKRTAHLSAETVQPAAPSTAKEIVVRDSLDRELVFRLPSIREKAKLMRILDDKDFTKQGFMTLVLLSVFVRFINGVPTIFPRNEDDVFAAMDRIGDEGIEALQEEMARLDMAVNEDEVLDEAKK